jgi:hypothetical protein
MVSLQMFASSCLGCPPTFSVLRDFFGYASAPPWTLAPAGEQSNLPQSLSVAEQINRLKQTHFSLDLIRVGTNGTVLPAVDEQNLDCAVQIARDIFAAIGVGIGRVDRSWYVPLSDNTGYEAIEDGGEAEDLIDEYTAPGGGIDVFFVPLFQGTPAGATPVKGDGVVVESNETTFLSTARTFAHELGHYFGLGHENDTPSNLMCQSSKPGVVMPGSTQLNQDQIDEIKDHDEMRSPC